MKKYIIISALATIVSLAGGCSKDVLEEKPTAILLADNLFVNKAGFDAGINGLYDEMRRVRAGGVIGQINEMMTTAAVIGTDNAYGNYVTANLEGVFNTWGVTNSPSVGIYNTEWSWLYETINSCNTVIGRADNPAVVWTPAEKNLALAEARAIRAWAYRHLIFTWGDVPLTLTESSGSTIRTDWDRTPVAEVRDAMEADWLFAEQYLPEVTPASNGKLLKGFVQHYLAELYLAEGKNDKARDYALKVTTNANYKLITARYGVNAAKAGTAFTDMFLDGNSNRSQGCTEALFVIQSELNVQGGDASNILRRYWVNRYYSLPVVGTDKKNYNPITVSVDNGGRGIGRFGPTKWALGLYPAGDDRGSDFAWRFSYTINTTDPKIIPPGFKNGDVITLDRTSNEKINNPNWPNTRKWDYASPVNVIDDRAYNDQIYLRSADTYLLLAEAYFKLGDLTNAANTINVLRIRAHAPTVTAAQITIDFILDERSRELFSEEERRYTLVRTGKYLERVKLYNVLAKATISDKDALLPIPQNVIDANLTKKMPQNPGY